MDRWALTFARPVTLAILMLLPWITVSCENRDEFHDPRVSNGTGQVIELAFVSGGVEAPLITLGVDVTASLTAFGGRCTAGTFIARTTTGIEVARRTEQLFPNETWLIEFPAQQPSASH